MDFQIPDKTLLTSVDRAADSLLIYDDSALALKRTTTDYLLDLTTHPVGVDDVQTLTNKTITAPTISSPVLSGSVTGTYTLAGTPTFPSSVVTLTGSQTLTNKVLTSPTINTATIANPTLTVDTVSEYTGANGVTIDGLNIKDSALTTNNSVPNTALSNSGAFNSNWAWTTWVPVFTNLSGGTLNYALYTQIGKTVHFRLQYTLASAGVAGAVSFTSPTTISSSYGTAPFSALGIASFGDSGTAQYEGWAIFASTTSIQVRSESNATNGQAVAISSTSPFTWGSTDVLYAQGAYEAA